MTYTVKYRLSGRYFNRKIKKVKGDLISVDIPVPMRVLILEDETRLEIPLDGTEFEFSKERFLVIKLNMEKQAGQAIPTPHAG